MCELCFFFVVDDEHIIEISSTSGLGHLIAAYRTQVQPLFPFSLSSHFSLYSSVLSFYLVLHVSSVGLLERSA